jgi:hypothetical protein
MDVESQVVEASSTSKAKRDVPIVELTLEDVTYAPIASTATQEGNKSERKRKVVLSHGTHT